MNGYRIEENQHGVLVFGIIPVDDLTDLHRMWKRKGLNVLDVGVSQAVQATFAVTKNEETAAAWRAELDAQAKSRAGGDRELTWLTGTDTGMSSKSIFARLTTRGSIKQTGEHPHDPSDFGRCYRLLKLIPEWRARIDEMKDVSSEWAGLVAVWPELERLYEIEIKSKDGMAPKLYAAMKKAMGRE